MIGKYDVLTDGKVIGWVKIIPEGLYIRIICHCNLKRDGFYRLVATCGRMRHDLGICVPKEDHFALETKVPIKRFGAEAPTFSVEKNVEQMTQIFEPLVEEDRFACIQDLDSAYFAIVDGQCGIMFSSQ